MAHSFLGHGKLFCIFGSGRHMWVEIWPGWSKLITWTRLQSSRPSVWAERRITLLQFEAISRQTWFKNEPVIEEAVVEMAQVGPGD